MEAFGKFRKSIGKVKVMSALREASVLVRQIAFPETGKAALVRVTRRLKTWTYNRVKDVYYADPRIRISGDEIDYLRAIAFAKKNEEYSSEPSIFELSERLKIVSAHLSRIDPTFHYPEVEELGGAPHPAGGEKDLPGRTDGSEE